jgi:hypothetical protein
MKTQVKWTNPEIAILQKYGANTLLHKLHEMLPSHTPLAISLNRKRLGIELSDDYEIRQGKYARSLLNNDDLCKLDHSLTIDDIDSQTLQILLGSILGDGSIKKNGSGGKSRGKNKTRNFIFYEGHQGKQFDYVKWKADKLSAFLSRFYGNNPNKPELMTVSHPIFSWLRTKFYAALTKSTKSKLPMDVLGRLDLLGLMIWYLDDGYVGCTKDGKRSKNQVSKPYPKITAKGYDYNELNALCENLNTRFNLSLHVTKYKHGGGWNKLVCIDVDDRNKLFPVWRQMAIELGLPSCMYYKLNMHNQELLATENIDRRQKLDFQQALMLGSKENRQARNALRNGEKDV